MSDLKRIGETPRGYGLWVRETPYGREYFTDENGVGAVIWSTACTDESSLLAAIVHEKSLRCKE